jgi:adenylate cyclase
MTRHVCLFSDCLKQTDSSKDTPFLLLHKTFKLLTKTMSKEIERKFLVKGEFKNLATDQIPIKQGYLCSDPERTVRVRLKGDYGYLTVKGKSDESGLSRYEWEKEIPADEANDLLKICEPGVIVKTRYLVKYVQHTFEIDEFYGENEGLVIAEVELQSENEKIEKPDWLGEEVTGDIRYFNSMLKKNPYKKW